MISKFKTEKMLRLRLKVCRIFHAVCASASLTTALASGVGSLKHPQSFPVNKHRHTPAGGCHGTSC